MTRAGEVPGVLMLWGEDEFLLRDAAHDALGDLRPREVDAADWVGGETADLATPSLFGEPRALLVTSCHQLSQEAARELKAYVAAPSPEATLVLTGRGVKTPPTIAKDVKGVGEVRRVEVTRRELPGWVVRRGRLHGAEVRPAAATALIETLGEDPAQLDQAIRQLRAAFPAEPITPELVTSQFRGLGDRKSWEVADRAFAGELAAALRALQGMLAARDDPLLILGGIAARVRDLERVAAVPDDVSASDLARHAGVRFEWQARRYRETARRYPPGALARLHLAVADADRALKSGATGDVVLPLLLARIAQPDELPPRAPAKARR